MTTNPSGFDPLWMFLAPWSGDVAQRITAPWFSPSLTVNYAGDPAVEDRAVTEVASYGKQLGWLTEIAIALAKRQPLPEETLRRLEKATKDIDAIKGKSALPPLRRRTTHSIASNATTQLNMISCCANGGATNSRKLQLRWGQWPQPAALNCSTVLTAHSDASTFSTFAAFGWPQHII